MAIAVELAIPLQAGETSWAQSGTPKAQPFHPQHLGIDIHPIPNIFADGPKSEMIASPDILHPAQRLNGQGPIVHGLVGEITKTIVENTKTCLMEEIQARLVTIQTHREDPEYTLEIIQLASQAKEDLKQFGNKYTGLLTPAEQTMATIKLIESVRLQPLSKQLELSSFFLSLENIGPAATETILIDLSKRAYEYHDLPERRRARYIQKAKETSVLAGSEAYFNSNILPTLHLNTSQGITDALAGEDRDTYLALTSKITPAGVRNMVGRVTTQELLHEIRYDAVCKAAANLLPIIGNPFTPSVPDKATIFEYFATHTPVGKPIKM